MFQGGGGGSIRGPTTFFFNLELRRIKGELSVE